MSLVQVLDDLARYGEMVSAQRDSLRDELRLEIAANARLRIELAQAKAVIRENREAIYREDALLMRLEQCHAALWLALDQVRQGYSDEELEKLAQDVPLHDWGIALVLYATLKATEASDG